MCNRQILNIDDELYADDEDMMYIIQRLHLAVSDPVLRMEMDKEDEYFSSIENRDTAIMQRDEKIKEQGAQLAEQGAQLAVQEKALMLSAKALKDAGVPLEQISVMTTLPIETILSL